MEPVENLPLGISLHDALLTDRHDLHLTWPACLPFNPEHCCQAMNPSHRLFLIRENRNMIGQAVLRATDDCGIYAISFLYLRPELRGQGRGRRLLALLEDYAMRELAAHQFTLVVQDHNPRAFRCYCRSGFCEYEREGTLIRMRKLLTEGPVEDACSKSSHIGEEGLGMPICPCRPRD